ncbi:hypothetical protein [Mongoliitalea lutea]|uniref:hypothetical protein n=1 Tax=Mongoliitalea lutea TaxID=849756 RepID=UPI0016768F53|nr:hypothetical protein [Mongoliitalea lutea]
MDFQKYRQSYCVFANCTGSIQKIINSLNSNEFECLGFFLLNERTLESLKHFAKIPDVLFLENCEEADAVKALFKMQYSRTSIVYLEQRGTLMRSNPPELEMGETILLI